MSDTAIEKNILEGRILLICIRIDDYFHDRSRFISSWWWTPNPYFGDVKPGEMMAIRPEKCVRIIESLLDGEGP